MITLIPAALILLSRQSPDWKIVPSFNVNDKAVWKVSIDVTIESQPHKATFFLERTIKSADQGAPVEAMLAMNNLLLDGQDANQANGPWSITLDSRGGLLSAGGDQYEAVRRMWAPFMLAYPDQDIPLGGTWNYTVMPTATNSHPFTYVYTDAMLDHVGDVDVLKVSCKFSEAGTESTNGDGTWWIARDGHVVKFEIHAKNWSVPMADQHLMDASITGEFVPNKS